MRQDRVWTARLRPVPVTTHSAERDAELLSRLDDGDADARDRRILVGPTFDELLAERTPAERARLVATFNAPREARS